jgi:DNA-binding response OmpR family regulator
MRTVRRSSTKLKASAPAKKRILVVEDEPSLQQSVRNHLVRRGFDVDAVSDSQAAIRAVKSHVPDLVFVDLHLPRESGYEVCEILRNELRLDELPIVMMGDATSPETRAFAEEAGANRYLNKPFAMRQLDALVDVLLETEARKA